MGNRTLQILAIQLTPLATANATVYRVDPNAVSNCLIPYGFGFDCTYLALLIVSFNV